MRIGVGVCDVGREKHRCHHGLDLDFDAGLLACLLDGRLGFLARLIDRGLVEIFQRDAALGADSVGIRYSPTRPGTAAASSLASQPVTDVTPATTYTVSKGDTLSSIAKKNQINKADLVAANHLKGTSVLHTGQKLIIPAKSGQASSFEPAPAEPAATAKSEPAAEKASMGEGTKHVVRNGETLGAIARKYGVKQGDIAVANNITDPKKIQPGQELVIPAKSGSSGGKQAKGSKAAPADNARGSTSAPTAKSAGAPPPDQDLDSGLKPTNAAEVPVVKIEEPASGPAPKSP